MPPAPMGKAGGRQMEGGGKVVVWGRDDGTVLPAQVVQYT